MYTIAITGITGKSGQYLLQRMLDEAEQLKEYSFILFCRKLSSNSPNAIGYAKINEALQSKRLNITVQDVDLTDSEAIEKVFSSYKIDMLFHIASVKLSWNLVPVALKCGVDDFVLVHTTGIYSKYKAAGEEYRQIESKIKNLVNEYRVNGRDVAVTILRPTMIYGDLHDKNISVFIKMVDRLRLFPVINGAKYDLQPVWCKDLGDAFFDVFMHWPITQNQEYILSGGEPIQLREMFKIIANQLGVKNIFVNCPYFIAYGGAWFLYCISFTKIDMREKIQRMVEPRAFPHNKAYKDFGYSPANFVIGVQNEVYMYKHQYY